ncbi:MAG: DUF2520 domain-containing protein [Terriglobales bacterium]
MDWSIVGAGRAGSALRQWLLEAGTPASAFIRHGQLDGWLQSLPRQKPGGILLAVPDDALPALARRMAIARAGKRSWQGWCVLHTSGTRPAAALGCLARRGASTAAMHPMMTITRVVPSPRGVVCSIEGGAAACRAARALVRRWGGHPLALSPQAKASYHLAATLVGPGAVVNFAAAEAILTAAGLSGPSRRLARTGLLHLLQATASNLAQGTSEAWTGPWARGDEATIAQQYRKMPTKALRELYRSLTQASRIVSTGSKGKR